MSLNIEKIITGIIDREGNFVDHPADKGGPTRWGITETVARMNGYNGDMHEFPASLAREIYRMQYYLKPHFDEVVDINSEIGEELVDTGVNMGPAVAAKMLQRALNVLNNCEKTYKDITVDGYLGHESLAAMHAYLSQRGTVGVSILMKVLNTLQGMRYIEIAEANPSQEVFVNGWFNTRVSI